MSGRDLHGGEISQKIKSPALDHIDFTGLTERVSFDARLTLETFDTAIENVTFRRRSDFGLIKARPYLEVEVTAWTETRRITIEQIIVRELELTPFDPSGKKSVSAAVAANPGETAAVVLTEAPKVFTLKWLWEHLPFSAYVKMAGFFATIAGGAFAAGKYYGGNSSHHEKKPEPKPQVEPSSSKNPHPPDSKPAAVQPSE